MEILRTLINLLRFNDKNWKAVVLCVVAATVFWFFNALNENYSANIRFPVAFEYDEAKFIPVTELPSTIRLNVSGLGWDLFRRSLGIKLPPLSIPLENPTEVKKIVGASLPVLFSSQLEGLQINYVLTDTIHLQIDPLATRKIYLSVDSAEQYVKENFRRSGEIQIEPEWIQVEGPKSLLEALPDTVSLTLEDTSIDKQYADDIEVEVGSDRINRNPPIVKVSFPVDRLISITDTTSLIIRNPSVGGKPEIQPNEIIYTYDLPVSLAQTANPESIQVTLDLSRYSTGQHKLIPKVTGLPKYSRLLMVDSVEVNF